MVTNICSSATASPYQGEVAHGYWQTLCHALTSLNLSLPADKEKHSQSSSIKVAQYLEALDVGISAYDDFGLRLGSSVSLQTYPVLGMTLLSCSQLHQALKQILRYESLNHDLGRSGLVKQANVSHFSWTPNPAFIPEPKSNLSFHLAMSVFAGIKTFAPLLTQADIPLVQLCFTANKPSNADVYRSFFNAEIRYQQAHNRISFKTELLDQTITGSDASMFSTLTSHADSLLLQGSNTRNTAWKVKSILPDALRKQAFRLEDVANKLNISTRTLQRKLSDSGYRYQALLDETRQQLAEMYLIENKLSMNEIAFLIGYQEQSSFNHAFKSWMGVSPSEYREANRLSK